MPTTVYLTRHGQTEWNNIGRMMGWTNEDLNETGRIQAERLAKRLENVPLDAVYCSPLQRAITTGAIVGAKHGVTPKTSQGLIEINYGIWEGMARTDVKEKWPELHRIMMDNPENFQYPGGESYKDLRVRVVAAFNDVVKAEEGRNLLMVSHQGILKILIAELMGISYNDWNKFEVRNASLTSLTVEHGHVHFMTLNEFTHLDGLTTPQG
jgi:broad specificity phosphatase PhoE